MPDLFYSTQLPQKVFLISLGLSVVIASASPQYLFHSTKVLLTLRFCFTWLPLHFLGGRKGQGCFLVIFVHMCVHCKQENISGQRINVVHLADTEVGGKLLFSLQMVKLSTLVVASASVLCFQFTMHRLSPSYISLGFHFFKKTKADLKNNL